MSSTNLKTKICHCGFLIWLLEFQTQISSQQWWKVLIFKMPNKRKKDSYKWKKYIQIWGKKPQMCWINVKIDRFFDKMLIETDKINKIKLSHCPVARGQLLAFVSHCLAYLEATSQQLVFNLRYDVLSVKMSELLSLPSKLVFTLTIVFFT